MPLDAPVPTATLPSNLPSAAITLSPHEKIVRTCYAGGPAIATASNLAAVVRPMQQRLALARPAGMVAGVAIAFDLAGVGADRLPALDLPRVVGDAAAKVIAAIPLEPAARVV